MLTFYVVNLLMICFVIFRPWIGTLLIGASFTGLFIPLYIYNRAADLEVLNLIYKLVIVSPHGREAKDEGLRSIHNDACYPALIVAGQFIAELKSGKYDLNKTLIIKKSSKKC